MAKNIAPLSDKFLIAAIVGFILSAFYIMPKNTTWGLTLLIFFSVMFLASFISMTKGPAVNLVSKRK